MLVKDLSTERSGKMKKISKDIINSLVIDCLERGSSIKVYRSQIESDEPVPETFIIDVCYEEGKCETHATICVGTLVIELFVRGNYHEDVAEYKYRIDEGYEDLFVDFSRHVV